VQERAPGLAQEPGLAPELGQEPEPERELVRAPELVREPERELARAPELGQEPGLARAPEMGLAQEPGRELAQEPGLAQAPVQEQEQEQAQEQELAPVRELVREQALEQAERSCACQCRVATETARTYWYRSGLPKSRDHCEPLRRQVRLFRHRRGCAFLRAAVHRIDPTEWRHEVPNRALRALVPTKRSARVQNR